MSITIKTLDDYGLGGVDCAKCDNTGAIITTRADGSLYARECECMKKRRSLKRIRESGLADLFPRYTFETLRDANSKNVRLRTATILLHGCTSLATAAAASLISAQRYVRSSSTA